jgi:beta-lactamase class A
VSGGRRDFPQFSRIFDDGTGKVGFNDDFKGHLTEMMVKSDNSAAGEVIQRIGFKYVNGALAKEGFFDKVGLWLGGDYVTGDEAKRKGYTDFEPVPLDKDVNKSVHEGSSTSQGATAEAVAKLLTLVASGRLISADASKEMQELMEKQKLESDFKTGLAGPPLRYSIRIYGKIGVGLGVGDDCAVIERTADLGGGRTKRIKYVAVGLREPVPYNLKKLIAALDGCVVQNNK